MKAKIIAAMAIACFVIAGAQTTDAKSKYVVSVTETEIDDMMRIVWMETGCCGCSYKTQYLTASVMVNRLLDWDYSSMTSTLYAKGQYSTAKKYTDWDGKKWSSLKGSSKIETTKKAVYAALKEPDRNPHYQAGFKQGKVYYVDKSAAACVDGYPEYFCY